LENCKKDTVESTEKGNSAHLLLALEGCEVDIHKYQVILHCPLLK
jgi:hypothetical protein